MRDTEGRGTDEQIMAAATERWQGTQNHVITNLEARVIASQWHGGQMSALYSFASCGAIRDDLSDECRYTFHTSYSDASDSPRELLALRDYVNFYGLRGPVEGWSQLHW